MGSFLLFDQKIVQTGTDLRSGVQGRGLADPRGRSPQYADSFQAYRGRGVAGTGQNPEKTEEKEEFSRAVRLCGHRPDLFLLPHGQLPTDPPAKMVCGHQYFYLIFFTPFFY